MEESTAFGVENYVFVFMLSGTKAKSVRRMGGPSGAAPAANLPGSRGPLSQS
jgi:hypothetical protein